jgi:hypothetical protein
LKLLDINATLWQSTAGGVQKDIIPLSFHAMPVIEFEDLAELTKLYESASRKSDPALVYSSENHLD